MQRESNPDDIHTILSRFQSWTGKQTGNRPRELEEDVREIPYEEAMGRLRGRRAPQSAAAAVTPVEPTAAVPVKLSVSAAAPKPAEADTPHRALPKKTSAAPRRLAAVPADTAPKSTSAAATRGLQQSTPAAKKKSDPSTAKKRTAKTAPPVAAAARKPGSQRAAPHQATQTDFRHVLAKSVQRKSTPAPTKSNRLDRSQRVSVRLSDAEEHKLQQCAARAGVTVSEYLRRRALQTEPAQAEARRNQYRGPEQPKTAAQFSPAVSAPVKSSFGDWITLLRNRFLSSPVRFAERA